MSLVEQWYVLFTLSIREVKRFMRIWVQTLVPPVISIMLYFLIFGAFIGPRIGEMGGRNYMEFILPGLVMMSVINNAYSNVASSFYTNKFQRSIECMLIAPIPNYLLLTGFVFGGVTRSLLTGLLLMTATFFFIKFEITHLLVTLAVIFLASVVFSLGGFINGMMADKFDDVTIVPTFILTPLTYLGGVFYDVELLSDFWRNLSYLNPIVYMVSGFRYGIFGDSSDIQIAHVFVMLSVFTLLLWGVSIYLLRKGFRIKY